MLEWVAISFSNAWKWEVKVKSLSRVPLFAIPWTAAYQAPPSMGFSRQEYWSRVPLPSPTYPATAELTTADTHFFCGSYGTLQLVLFFPLQYYILDSFCYQNTFYYYCFLVRHLIFFWLHSHLAQLEEIWKINWVCIGNRSSLSFRQKDKDHIHRSYHMVISVVFLTMR